MTGPIVEVFRGTLTEWYLDQVLDSTSRAEKVKLGPGLRVNVLLAGDVGTVGLSSVHISPREKTGDGEHGTGRTSKRRSVGQAD